MQNYLLKPLVGKIKKHDMSVFFQVFEEFKRLITFYGKKLKYEDASSELTLFFIELLNDIDLSKFKNDEGEELHRYIAVSLKNKYIALSLAKEKNIKFENTFCETDYGITQAFDDNLCVARGIVKLNESQRMVFYYHYIYGYSIAEIAYRLNVSRQAVYKTKNQVLEILRKEFM